MANLRAAGYCAEIIGSFGKHEATQSRPWARTAGLEMTIPKSPISIVRRISPSPFQAMFRPALADRLPASPGRAPQGLPRRPKIRPGFILAKPRPIGTICLFVRPTTNCRLVNGEKEGTKPAPGSAAGISARQPDDCKTPMLHELAVSGSCTQLGHRPSRAGSSGNPPTCQAEARLCFSLDNRTRRRWREYTAVPYSWFGRSWWRALSMMATNQRAT